MKTAKVEQATRKLAADNAALVKAKKDLANANKTLSAAKTSLKESLTNEDSGDCEDAITEVLAKNKISREVYFGGAFIGPSCKVLIEKSAAIFADIRVVLKKLKKEGVSDAFVDELIFKYDALFREFDVCVSVMRSIDMQTDEAIEAFGESSKAFGVMWRKTFGPNPRVTPKLHILESHVYRQLLRFGVLGLFSEDPIERLHHQHLVATRRLCNIREYEKRERFLWAREAAINNTAVQNALDEASANRKRRFSAASEEKRKRKLGEADKKLCIKIEKAVLFIKSKHY